MDLTGGLRLTPAQWRTIAEHLTRELPNEACGLIAAEAGAARPAVARPAIPEPAVRGRGIGDRANDKVVRAVYPVANALKSPVAYEMDPVQQVEVMAAIEDAGWELAGIYHSHPAGPERPSPTDVAQAYYPDSVYIICSPRPGGGWRGRAFRIEAGRVTEVPWVISPEGE
jgi:proteasome lid subunit RPN8/RPN11